MRTGKTREHMENRSMRDTVKGETDTAQNMLSRGQVRLLMGMAVALVVMTVLVMAARPGASAGDGAMLSQAMLQDKAEVDIDSDGLANRVVEQKFQIHMEEMDQQLGEIPYVEVWVLNDPFYPCLLYTSPSPRDRTRTRMPSSA